MFASVARPWWVRNEGLKTGCHVGKHVAPIRIAEVPDEHLSKKLLENHGKYSCDGNDVYCQKEVKPLSCTILRTNRFLQTCCFRISDSCRLMSSFFRRRRASRLERELDDSERRHRVPVSNFAFSVQPWSILISTFDQGRTVPSLGVFNQRNATNVCG